MKYLNLLFCFFSLRRQNEDLRAKLSMFEASNAVPNEVAEAEARKLKEMHEKECRELRLTIKSLVKIKLRFVTV